jgi:hypothetical protein
MTLDSHFCKKIIPMVGSPPISWVDVLHASSTCLIILGLPSLSTHRFEGDMLY